MRIERQSPFITLTGLDERTDIDALAGLHVEFGFLFRERRSPSGGPYSDTFNRYPSWSWMASAAYQLHRSAIHICGMGARALLMSGRFPEGLGAFQRIQVNGEVTPHELLEICHMYGSWDIVTQLTPTRNRDLLGLDLPNHHVLVDASGGRGVLPDSWVRPETIKPVGFAGGLGAHNLTQELPKIAKVAGNGTWWVDMEANLRTEDDWFSVDKARAAVTQFQATLKPA